jgi:hypothetical protein
MRKAIEELDEEQRAALLEVADLGIAVCGSALIVSVLRLIGGLIY